MRSIQGRFAAPHLFLCCLVPLLSLSCSSKNSPNDPEGETEAATLRISVAADSRFSAIAESAVVVVSGVDFDAIRHPLVITDSGLTGSLNGIPVGRERRFDIWVYDTSAIVQYAGSTTAEVTKGLPLTLTIKLSRVEGGVHIIGKVEGIVYNTLSAPFGVTRYFVPSGFMGDGETPGKITHTATVEKPRSSDPDQTVTKVAYLPGTHQWGGVYWQHPEGNWGLVPGRKVLLAQKITFWACGKLGTEVVQFKAGGIFLPGPYVDSFESALPKVTLSSAWERYEISLSGRDLGSVIGAFAWIADAEDNPAGAVFYLDDIRYE